MQFSNRNLEYFCAWMSNTNGNLDLISCWLLKEKDAWNTWIKRASNCYPGPAFQGLKQFESSITKLIVLWGPHNDPTKLQYVLRGDQLIASSYKLYSFVSYDITELETKPFSILWEMHNK